MTVNTSTQRPLPGELILAAGLIFLAALPMALFAVMTVGDGGFSLTTSSLGPLAFALLLMWVGVEVLRRRHWAVAVSVPALFAIAGLGYTAGVGSAAGSNPAAGFWAAAYWLAVVLLVVSKRRQFR